MRVIIAGSRECQDYSLVLDAIKASNFEITQVVSGGARGVDKLGEQWALEQDVSVRVFPANWDKFSNSAGPIRNSQMADYANALIAIWDGKSKGTSDMIKKATKLGLKVYVHQF